MNEVKVSNAMILDKSNIGLDPIVRQSLKIFHQRNIYVGIVKTPSLITMTESEDFAIMETADNPNNYDFLILTWEGVIPNIYYYHEACINHILQLEEKTNGQWLVSGQIIDQYENRLMFNDSKASTWQGSFYLFPITAIVNLKTWRKIGRPQWGQQNLAGVEHMIPARSTNNIHDNYTPTELNGTLGRVTGPVKKGWNIIDASIANDLPVYNLSSEIRNSQVYTYPEKDPVMFNNFWRSLYTMPKLDEQYHKILQMIIDAKAPKKITNAGWGYFIRNTEEYVPVLFQKEFYDKITAVDTLMFPCSGFKDLVIYSKTDRNKVKKIIHFDIIRYCVEIKRKFVDEWDGTRSHFTRLCNKIKEHYKETAGNENCFRMNSMTSFDEAYDDILKNFESEKQLESVWQEFKKINHVYINADILGEPELVTKHISNNNVYCCLSDIAVWRNNVIAYGYVKLRNQLSTVAKQLMKNNCFGMADYKDPGTDLQMIQTFEELYDFLEAPPHYE